jgi:hypothetical protein
VVGIDWNHWSYSIGTGAAITRCATMLGVFAEFETNLRRHCQLEGIAESPLQGP